MTYGHAVATMADAVSTNLAHNIRRLREARGLTQQQMATLSGVPRPTWANLESGEANPTIGVLTRVADSLQAKLEDLLSAPQASAQFYASETLPTRRRGKALLRSLTPDAPPGLTIDRMELDVAAKLVAEAHVPGTREYLTCERGEIEVATGGQAWVLRAGDVLVFRGDQERRYKNCGRSRAVAFCFVAFDPVST